MNLSTLLGLLSHGIVIDSPYDFTAVKLAAGGFQIKLDTNGNLGFYNGSTEEFVLEGPDFRVFDGGAYWQYGTTRLSSSGLPTQVAGTATVGRGFAPIYGLDNRSGITAADGAPITLYSVPAGANQLFDAAIEIDATAFTSGTATYTLTYTQNGVAQTVVVTATAINVVTGVRRLIQPDPSTLITVQLTGPFVATVRLSAAVMQLA